MLKKPQPPSNIENLLLLFRRKVIDACKKEGMQYELTFSQMEILRFIGENQSVTMKDIAQYLKITPPSATALVSEMEKKSLIARASNRKDRRIITIAFTQKASRLFEKISKRKQTILSRMLGRLSDKDKATLERIIRILVTE